MSLSKTLVTPAVAALFATPLDGFTQHGLSAEANSAGTANVN